MKFHIQPGPAGGAYWTLQEGDLIIAESVEDYDTSEEAKAAAAKFKEEAQAAELPSDD